MNKDMNHFLRRLLILDMNHFLKLPLLRPIFQVTSKSSFLTDTWGLNQNSSACSYSPDEAGGRTISYLTGLLASAMGSGGHTVFVVPARWCRWAARLGTCRGGESGDLQSRRLTRAATLKIYRRLG